MVQHRSPTAIIVADMRRMLELLALVLRYTRTAMTQSAKRSSTYSIG